MSRAEALLRNMEEKTCCVRRDMECRKAAKVILEAARQQLALAQDDQIRKLAGVIVDVAEGLGE